MTSCTQLLLSDPETGERPACGLPAFVIDVAAGVLVAANAAGCQVWGQAAGGAAGDDFHPVPLDRAMPALASLSEAAGSPSAAMLTFWTARGLLQLRCRVAAIASEPGRFLVRAAGARHDIRPDAPSEAPSSSPVQVRDVARLAHEVRTPLSAAIAYAELLKEEHFGPLGSARYREYARNAYDSARLALSVVDGMLARDLKDSAEPREAAVADVPELSFRDLDPAGVIDNCVAVARPLAERAGIVLTASYDPSTPRVIADEVSLKQMLLNLITNAIKFARPGDRVTLAATYGDDGCLRIEVSDTGPGMPNMPASGIDAPAPPPEPAVGGAAGHGIGLPLTRALAEANGAALIVDSAPGRGTRVTIAFGTDRVVPV